MLEPIIENKLRKDLKVDPFQIEVVEEFSKNSSKFKKKYDFPARHYSQIVVKLTPEVIKNILKKLSITPANKTITLFGGYTGQFAEVLRTVGFSVIFTDPIEEYVKRARKKGFRSFCYSVEELPSDIIQKSDLFATFECYMPFDNASNSVYTSLRLLSTPYGFIFAESKRTRKDLKKEGGKGALKSQFKPFEDSYSIERRYREHKGLRFYHFIGDDDSRNYIISDCKVIKLLYDNSKRETKIDFEFVNKISEIGGLSETQVIQSIQRILAIYRGLLPKSLQRCLPSNEFSLFSKNFIYELSL